MCCSILIFQQGAGALSDETLDKVYLQLYIWFLLHVQYSTDIQSSYNIYTVGSPSGRSGRVNNL